MRLMKIKINAKNIFDSRQEDKEDPLWSEIMHRIDDNAKRAAAEMLKKVEQKNAVGVAAVSGEVSSQKIVKISNNPQILFPVPQSKPVVENITLNNEEDDPRFDFPPCRIL
jgi:peptide deformylase